jgi:hypothetical protein
MVPISILQASEPFVDPSVFAAERADAETHRCRYQDLDELKEPMSRPSHATPNEKLKQMIEEATVDCYNESEQVTGLFTMIDENLHLPFERPVLGVSVVVERLDLSDREEIVAICSRGRDRQSIPILDLPLPSPPPEGEEWIEAYRHWLRG